MNGIKQIGRSKTFVAEPLAGRDHCGTLSHPTAARSGLAQFSAVSIMNTGGKGSRRKGKEEFNRHSTLLASPQFLVAVRVRLPVPFVCNETHELGEELVGSARYQVHLLRELARQNARTLDRDL
jgi:hypothetical protein